MSSDWKRIMDTLHSWIENPPGKGYEDEMTSPAQATIGRASTKAIALFFAGIPAPTTVGPDTDGAVTFEWHYPDTDWYLSIEADGSMYFELHKDGELLFTEDTKRKT